MRHRTRPTAAADESGAVAVVSALTLTMLLLFAAFVIDLGFLRADRAAGQSVADLAAAAGVQVYEPQVAGSAFDACDQARSYAEANLAELPHFSPPLVAVGSGCAVFPTNEICDPTDVKTATYTAGEFTVVITNPVLDGTDLMLNASYGDENDGRPCERFGVEVHRTRDFYLAAAGGSDRSAGQTTMSAVGRARAFGEEGEYASLIVLHQQSCRTLIASGNNTKILVEGLWRVEPDEDGNPQDVYYPGIITVDALVPGSGCGTNSEVIDLDGGGAEIKADDHLYSYALRQGANPDHVHPNPPPVGLTPPEPGPRITRSPVDHVYNCLATYPSGSTAPYWSPGHPLSVSQIDDCEEAAEIPPYLKNLYDGYQNVTAASLPSADWDVIDGGDCSALTGTFGSAAGATHDPLTTGRNWFIDCPGVTGNNGFTPNAVHFDGVDAIVTTGQIALQSSNSLSVTGTSDNGAVLYLQQGSMGGQGQFSLMGTFVYIDGAVLGNPSTKPLDITGSGAITWRAPLGNTPTSCDGYTSGIPPAGCFSPLALWSNAKREHRLGGGGALDIAGSFFTPNADPFSIAGGGGQTLDEAQFFAGRLRTDGGGTVTMTPNPDTNIEIPLTGRGLIR